MLEKNFTNEGYFVRGGSFEANPLRDEEEDISPAFIIPPIVIMHG